MLNYFHWIKINFRQKKKADYNANWLCMIIGLSAAHDKKPKRSATYNKITLTVNRPTPLFIKTFFFFCHSLVEIRENKQKQNKAKKKKFKHNYDWNAIQKKRSLKFETLSTDCCLFCPLVAIKFSMIRTELPNLMLFICFVVSNLCASHCGCTAIVQNQALFHFISFFFFGFIMIVYKDFIHISIPKINKIVLFLNKIILRIHFKNIFFCVDVCQTLFEWQF